MLVSILTMMTISMIPLITGAPDPTRPDYLAVIQVRQSPGVKAVVDFYFTVDTLKIPATNTTTDFKLTCIGAQSTARLLLTEEPNDFHYDMLITWSNGSQSQEVEDVLLLPFHRHFTFAGPEGPESVSLGNRRGPAIDVFRAKVIKNPDAQLIAMQTEEGVVLTDLIRTGDIEKLSGDGFTIMSAPGFHMGHVGYNLRPDRDYLEEPIQCNPDAAPFLSDVNFRHALFHLYNQEEIVSSIYGYIVTPVQSLVPPAQGGWVNPEVPVHPYNPGDPEGTTVYDPETGENEDACSILRYGGYTYDSGLDNWVHETNGPVPPMQVWTPTYEVAPTSAEHGARWVQTCNDYGITSFSHVPREFSPYMDDVEIGDFDIYMVFWSLGRFPDHLYTMCHSDHDVEFVPGDYNFPGCRDPDLDDAVFTIISSLDHEAKMEAAHLAQMILYNESYPLAAFSYMQLYSRIYFNAFNPDLRGIVNSPGYGADNGWTYLNLRWDIGTERYTPEGKTIIEWIWGEEPELLNPCSSDTVYAWDLIEKVQDGLIAVNPYTHEDIPWLATDWEITEWPNQGPGNDETWMNVTFTLREDAYWQDGNPFIADDVKFNWEFLKDNEIPRYKGMWQFLQFVETAGNTVRAVMNTTSQFLIYDLAGTAALLPPPVWGPLDGQPLNTIMEYDPSNVHAPSTGPWFGMGQGFPDNYLYGTGAFVFEYYDPITMVADLGQFPKYFLTTEEIHGMKVEMFHLVGDVNRDGYIDVFDLARVGAAYGSRLKVPPDPRYDAEADINSDGRVEAKDLAYVAFNWGEQREYPVPAVP